MLCRSHPTLAAGIGQVFGLRPQPQMVRAYTGRIVTVVTDDHSSRDGTVGQLPCDAVGSQWGTSSPAAPHLPIATCVGRTAPQPATVRPLHFRPEAVRQRPVSASEATELAAPSAGIGRRNLEIALAPSTRCGGTRRPRPRLPGNASLFQVAGHVRWTHMEVSSDLAACQPRLGIQPHNLRSYSWLDAHIPSRHPTTCVRAVATRNLLQSPPGDLKCVPAGFADSLDVSSAWSGSHVFIIPCTSFAVTKARG